MPTIIRATDQNMATASVAFNFDDMAGEAKKYVDQVRIEGKIVMQAQQEAAAVRTQAQAQGRQAALAEVDQMIARQLSSVIPARCDRQSLTSTKRNKRGLRSGKPPAFIWRPRSPSGSFAASSRDSPKSL